MGRWSLAEKISNNNFRTITQGLLSSSFAFLLQDGSVYGWLVPSWLDCQSTIIFQRGKCGQGESVARVRSEYRWLGTSKALRSSGPLRPHPSPRFGFVSCCFYFWSSLFSSPCFHDHGALLCVPWTVKIKRAKETNTRRPKVISPAVMSPEIYS